MSIQFIAKECIIAKKCVIAKNSRRGQTLVEVLVALGILGTVVLGSLETFGMAFTMELRIQEQARKASYAEWWFNRLEFPLTQAKVDKAPRTDEYGGTRFEWSTVPGDYNTLRVILRVSNGSKSDTPFVTSRVY
ncbi:MAG: prepilin-type N-terminal cleavage/methylation domain-containing protein [Synergistaceae bacterium]|jgi:prepilin-type N-terminal cleavage/methylation domain-containing protein|nr:prepilin-type N-terminal cleavage/methylation domain-containing protein [Synergistaceae bacterium]